MSKKLYARDIIQRIIKANDYSDYLEIGVDKGFTFLNILVPGLQHGVDPAPADKSGTTHKMTSDEFFAKTQDTYDIIFIDGLHQAQQAYRDARNALKILNTGGTIVMHDCNPPNEECQHPEFPGPNTAWTGDVWKAWVLLRCEGGLKMAVLDMDYGVGIIQPNDTVPPMVLHGALTYELLEDNRVALLNLIHPAKLATVFNLSEPD